jgi:hypothetical protein
MKRRKGIVAIVALVVVFCFAISAYADPGPKPLTQVEVINAPNVNAAQNGAWNVGISGTPNVAVTNTPTVAQSGTWNVEVSNSTANPIPVDDINGGLKDVRSFFAGFNRTNARPTWITLAANESFVITDVVVYITNQDGSNLPRLSILAKFPAGFFQTRHQVNATQSTDDVVLEQHFVSGIRFNPEEEIVLDASNSPSTATYIVSLSGYYL